MDTVSAVDTLGLVYLTDSVLIICDGTHGTCFFAGTLKMHDGTERACLSAHTALLTFLGVDMHPYITGGDGIHLTGIKTCFSQTESAIVGYGISGKRTFVACCVNDLNDVV